MACSLFLYRENSCIRGEPDQAPRSATPDLRLHCLQEGSYLSLHILT